MTDTTSLSAQIEARESGWYWVRQHEVGPYTCAYWNGNRWFDGPERRILPAEIGPPIPDPVTIQQRERLEATVVELETAYQNCAELAMTYHGQIERLKAVVEAARMVWEVERLHEEANIRGGKLLELGRCLAALGTAPEMPNTDTELALARKDTAQNTAAR